MLKMNIFQQPFMIVVVIYLIALSESIKAAIEKTCTKIDVIKFTTAVIGLGLFVYFQGRSHIGCLVGCSWTMYIVIAILIENYYNKFLEYRKKENNLSKFLTKTYLAKFLFFFILCSLICTRCLLSIVAESNTVNKYKQYLSEHNTQTANLKLLRPDIDYDFITQDATFYYLYFKKPNLLPFSSIMDCFLKSDTEKIYEYLKTSNNRLVIDTKSWRNLDIDFIEENYYLESTNNNIYILTKRK